MAQSPITPAQTADAKPRASIGMRLFQSLLMAGATILLTLLLMALTRNSGGFADGSGMTGGAASAGPTLQRMSLPVMIHLATVIPALPLGAYVLWRRKGDAVHKLLGRIWASLMMITATASFFIGHKGSGISGSGFSFIHIFSVITLISIPMAIWLIRRGDVINHEHAMRGPYIGLIIAGLFSFLPGRILGNLAFG